VVALYDKFKSTMKISVNSELLSQSRASSEGTSRELVKNISDVLWNSLSRSYTTDKPHLQSLYTYLTGKLLNENNIYLLPTYLGRVLCEIYYVSILTTIYMFIGNKLDCFGLALGVVAGAQILGLSDVHLALSEDHGWVVFGRNGELNAEVTWHGKSILILRFPKRNTADEHAT
jgi:menin